MNVGAISIRFYPSLNSVGPSMFPRSFAGKPHFRPALQEPDRSIHSKICIVVVLLKSVTHLVGPLEVLQCLPIVSNMPVNGPVLGLFISSIQSQYCNS